MAFTFSQNSIDRLKESVDIVDVIGRVVELKKAGSTYKGLCPFHKEKTPSFTVYAYDQNFYCFGCKENGDVIEFVRKYYNMDFSDAVQTLADQYGITLEKDSYGDDRSDYYNINRMAAKYYFEAMTRNRNPGYSYIKGRGLTDKTIVRFGIGYADPSWDGLYRYMKSMNVDEGKLLNLGLISERNGKRYDKFRNRVVFPIINARRKVIGFGGRALDPDDHAKYLNSPESIIFKKKRNLYGLNIAAREISKYGFLIIVEGYMDCIALNQYGIGNVVATLGTALTDDQARLIRRHAFEAVLSYDSDVAGRVAALKGIEALRRQNCKVKVLHVTEGKDPDEFVKKNGKKAFLALIDKALPYGEYKLSSEKIKHDVSTDQGRIDYIKAAVNIIRLMTPVEQEIYKQKLSRDMEISEEALDREIFADVKKDKPENTERREYEGRIAGTKEVTQLEKTLLKLIAADSSYIEKISQKKDDIFSSQMGRAIYNKALSEYKVRGVVEFNRMRSDLSEEEEALVDEICTDFVLDDNLESVYNQCLQALEKAELSDREQKLIERISAAERENDSEAISELTKELMRVQREKIKKDVRRGNHD